MKLKNIIILTATAAALAVIAFVDFDKKSAEFSWKALDQVITKIELQKGTESVILEKKDDRWFMEPHGWIASTDKVSGMIDVVKSARDFELISDDPLYKKFDLDEEEGVQAEFFQNEQLLRKLKVGKNASTYKHTYVIPGDEKNIYQTSGNFRSDFNKTKSELRDKKIFDFKKELVVSLKLKQGTDVKELTYVQKEKPQDDTNARLQTPEMVWKDLSGQTCSQKDVSDILNVMSSLSAESFTELTAEDLEGKDPVYEIEAETDTHTFRLVVVEEKENKYVTFSPARKYAFLISKGSADKLMKDFSKIITE